MTEVIVGVSIGVAMIIINNLVRYFTNKKQDNKKESKTTETNKKKIEKLEEGQTVCQYHILPLLLEAAYVQVDALKNGKTNGRIDDVHKRLYEQIFRPKAEQNDDQWT